MKEITYFGSKNMLFQNINDLRQLAGKILDNYGYVLGYFSPGDGGGGNFYWDSNSTEIDNSGTIFQVVGSQIGRWKRIIENDANIRWFGATGSITQDVTTIIGNALEICLDLGININFPTGNYLLSDTIVIEGSFKSIKIVGANKNETQLHYPGIASNTNLFQINGGSGGMTGGGIFNFTFIGNNLSCAIEVAGKNGYTIENCRFGENKLAVRFNNRFAGEFTEFCVLKGCDFREECSSALEYKVTGTGDASFHGSGLLESNTFNFKSGDLNPAIIVGENACPYNSPLFISCWTRTNGQVLVQNNTVSQIYFYGHISSEGFNSPNPGINGNACKLFSKTGNASMILFAGTVTGITYYLIGDGMITDAIMLAGPTYGNGTIYNKKEYSLSRNIVNGENVIARFNDYDYQTLYLIRLTVIGPFYQYHCYIRICPKNDLQNDPIDLVSEYLIFNQVGLGNEGKPMFSLNANNELVIAVYGIPNQYESQFNVSMNVIPISESVNVH